MKIYNDPADEAASSSRTAANRPDPRLAPVASNEEDLENMSDINIA